MGILSWFSFSRKEKKNTNPYSDSAFLRGSFASNKHAGVTINYSTAMRHNDVYSCVRIKAESLGQLPVRLYRTEQNRRTEILAGREHKIFTQRPNAYQTWQEFIEQFVTSLELLGKFSAEVKRNRFGNVYGVDRGLEHKILEKLQYLRERDKSSTIRRYD